MFYDFDTAKFCVEKNQSTYGNVPPVVIVLIIFVWLGGVVSMLMNYKITLHPGSFWVHWQMLNSNLERHRILGRYLTSHRNIFYSDPLCFTLYTVYILSGIRCASLYTVYILSGICLKSSMCVSSSVTSSRKKVKKIKKIQKVSFDPPSILVNE